MALILLRKRSTMKLAVSLCVVMLGAFVAAYPEGGFSNGGGFNGGGGYNGGGGGDDGGQKEGSFFTNEAIRQAQNTYLIPKDATIQKVQEGVELAAFEGIPGDKEINLFKILGEHVPPEVVSNLQTQVDQIGKH
uniref:DUF4168 domain-containing protein n=1 Tax=Timema bartmani TaxID=61472 RepID=A0A7R9I0S3_9NEOP|nr:unnamed protein product [Timema bartmani]